MKITYLRNYAINGSLTTEDLIDYNDILSDSKLVLN